VAASRAAASAGATLESLRRDAAGQLNHQLGPVADEFTLKIERAKSMPELQPLLVQGTQMLQRVKGSASAQAFVARFIGAAEE
jgi:hypothetical protein